MSLSQRSTRTESSSQQKYIQSRPATIDNSNNPLVIKNQLHSSSHRLVLNKTTKFKIAQRDLKCDSLHKTAADKAKQESRVSSHQGRPSIFPWHVIATDDMMKLVTSAQHSGGTRFNQNKSSTSLLHRLFFFILVIVIVIEQTSAQQADACRFYPLGENRRFERVAENFPVGNEVFKVEVHPRIDFRLEAVDNSLSDINYFKYEVLDDRNIAIKLAHSLEDLVDRREPQSVLKFKLTCKGASGTEEAFLPVTVYVQDVNDHAPEFQNVPYSLEVDEEMKFLKSKFTRELISGWKQWTTA